MAIFDKNVAAANESLEKIDDETLRKMWTLRHERKCHFSNAENSAFCAEW